MKKIFTLIITLATMIFAAGCATGNNHLAVEDFCQYLIDNGVPVTQVQPLRTEVFAAQHAWAFQIDGKADQEIGVYKYDITNNKMRERLEKYQEAWSRSEWENFFPAGTACPAGMRANPVLLFL